MVVLNQYTDKYGKKHDTIHDVRWANINYEMMKVLTEDVELVVADAENLLNRIKDNDQFRTQMLMYCQIASVQEILEG